MVVVLEKGVMRNKPVCVRMCRRKRDGLSKALPQTSQGSMFRDGFKFDDCLPRGRTGKIFALVCSITFTSKGTWFGLAHRDREGNDSLELREICSLLNSSLPLGFFGVETERSNGDSDDWFWVYRSFSINLPCKESRIKSSLWNIGLKRGKKEASGKRAIIWLNRPEGEQVSNCVKETAIEEKEGWESEKREWAEILGSKKAEERWRRRGERRQSYLPTCLYLCLTSLVALSFIPADDPPCLDWTWIIPRRDELIQLKHRT